MAELDAWSANDDGEPEQDDLRAKAKAWLAAQLALGAYVAVEGTEWKGRAPLQLPGNGGTLLCGARARCRWGIRVGRGCGGWRGSPTCPTTTRQKCAMPT